MTLAANASEYFPDTQTVSRLRGAARAWRVALVLSAVAHALLVIGYLTQYVQPQRLKDSSLITFELRLEPEEVNELADLEEAPSPPAPLVQNAPLTEPEITQAKPLTEPSPESPAAVSLQPVERQVLTTTAPPKRPDKLNLERPKDWEALATVPADESNSLVFKRSSAAAIVKRRQEQDAARSLSRAQIARLGLPEEQFRRRTDAGEEVKTAKGCFIKRVEHGPTGMQERWWRTACKDSRKPGWKRDELSFGPDHRPENSLTQGKSDCPNGRCWAY